MSIPHTPDAPAEVLSNYVGGTWIPSAGERVRETTNPATGEILARIPLSGDSDADRAVTVARDAFEVWSRVPMAQRVRYLARFGRLLEDHQGELARTITREHGQPLDRATSRVRRAAELLQHACTAPFMLLGESVMDVAAGIDCDSTREPLGVFVSITPSELPVASLGNWPFAVVAGNTAIVKPSPGASLAEQLVFDLVHEAKFPSGVVNLVHGDASLGQELIDHPGIVGVTFVGSSAVARQVYASAANAGKRVQALGGAMNHIVVMPDADLDRAVPALVAACFGRASQRCTAGSVVVGVGDAHDDLCRRLVDAAGEIVVGNGLESGVDLGPLPSGRKLDRLLSALSEAESLGARVLLDGRRPDGPSAPGHWISPTVLADVPVNAGILREELGGPVVVLRRANDLAEAVAGLREAGAMSTGATARSAAIFTRSARAAREFRRIAQVSTIGVNIGTPVPMALLPTGAARGSFTGDTEVRGDDAFRFYTGAKVVVSRWF